MLLSPLVVRKLILFNVTGFKLSQQMAGVVGFNVCVTEMMSPEDVSAHFRGVLHIEAIVQTEDGQSVKATDYSCAVNKQLIDLQFTSDTRKHYKPGLSFSGKVCTNCKSFSFVL